MTVSRRREARNSRHGLTIEQRNFAQELRKRLPDDAVFLSFKYKLTHGKISNLKEDDEPDKTNAELERDMLFAMFDDEKQKFLRIFRWFDALSGEKNENLSVYILVSSSIIEEITRKVDKLRFSDQMQRDIMKNTTCIHYVKHRKFLLKKQS